MSKIKREQASSRIIWILVFVTVSVFCIIFFAAQGRFVTPFVSQTVMTALAPFQRAASWAGDQVNGVMANVWDIMTVHQQNKQLRNEVEQLRVQNVKAAEYAAENIRLRELLGYKDQATWFDLVIARVIGREPATWTRMIVIDRGTQHGVQKNMAVVTSRGLVGVVHEAGPVSSKVRMILDPRASVGALVQRSRVTGIVEGSPENSNQPRLCNIPRNEDIAAGDILVTSGLGGIYPKGIMIGRVEKLRHDSTGLLHLADVETAVDFQRLEDVAVIVAAREAPPEPIKPPPQTPGTETDPAAAARAAAAAAQPATNPAPATAPSSPAPAANPQTPVPANGVQPPATGTQPPTAGPQTPVAPVAPAPATTTPAPAGQTAAPATGGRP
ncbi:MAG: rod shape-determining protein MreC [Schwartzia sp.]|nr:rod shape-determining protein MreC [Schwartzia sp. (in: firmicutes)]